MAVTITVDALSAAVRLGDSAEELTEITRLHAYATEAVEQYAPNAPETTANEAVVRLAAQMFDQPTATRGAYSNALRNSGAARILMPYRIHRAGSTQDAIAVAQGAVGTVGNPVTDVDVSAGELVITFNDGTTETHTLPSAGTFGVDQAARDSAEAAQTSADTAQTAADTAQTDIDDHETNHPSAGTGIDQTARDAATAAQGTADANAVTQTTHDTDPNAHHVPPTGGGADQTARDAAQTAQDAADAAQTDIDDHEANHPTGGGGGVGVPVTTTKEDIRYKRWTLLADLDSQALTNTTWFTVPQHITGNNLVCPATGEIEVTLWAKSGNRDNSIAYLKTTADSLRVTPSLGEMQIALGANRWVGVRTNSLLDNEIQVKVQDDQAAAGGNFSITINHIEELTQEVVTDVTGNVIDGGGGGEGLTAAGITGITAAPNDAVHSSAVFPGVFGGVLHKFSFANIIALMRSTVGLGRQINPGGSTGNLGKVPVLTEDGSDFHYQLQKPAELPTIASDAPTNPSHLNSAIIYKDTPEGDTATELYYKRRHDRESVIIAMNDTSPRSFGTEHRSFGWTSISILDTAEPVPGVTPYPSTPPHWEAFIRAQNIASGLLEWRLYTDELFTTLDTIYLDMRDQGDPDTHIQNVAMTKPVNEAYWTSGTYTSTNFPFYSVAGRLARPIIRIRSADDTLSASIIHLIPIDDVREALVDEDRLHQVYADLQDIFLQHLENLTPSGGPTLLGSYTGTLSSTAWTVTTLTPTAGKAMIGIVYVGENTHNIDTWHGWSMSWFPRTRFDATNAADGAWRYNVRTTGSQVIFIGRTANGQVQLRVNGVQTETFEFEFWEM